MVTVSGTGFQAGLSVTALFPNGSGSATLNGAQIQNVTATSFRMLITLGSAGTWGIRVSNPDGQQSGIFTFNVNAPVSTAPVISSISPATPTADGIGNQTVDVSGNNFQAGLTVLVTWPGGSSTLSGTQIQNVGPTSFRMVIDFGAGGGSWTIRVTNPGGQQSSAFGFSVNTAPQPQLRVDGSTSSSKQIGQTFTYTGTLFHAGHTVTRYISPQVNNSSILLPVISADGSGNIGWTFTPTCGNPKVTFTVYIVDDVTGRQSNVVTQTVLASPSCP